MKRVARHATVHESTVQALAAGELDAPTRPRRMGRAERTALLVTRVDLRVWRRALKLADGDNQRIEVKSPTSVVVHDTTSWKVNRAGD